MKIQDATNIYIGTTSASAVYLGTNQIWSSSNDPQEQQVQHEFLSPTSGTMIEGEYDSNSTSGYMKLLAVGSAADNYSTNVLDDTNYTNLITITSDTGGCVSLDLMDDGNGHYEPYLVISAGSGTCTLTYDDGTNTCYCIFDYSITDVASQSAGDMTSVQITDMASDNGLSSGQTMQYEEEWHGDSQRFIIRNKSTAGTGVAYYHNNTGDQLRIYGSATVEFEYDTHQITKIVMNCTGENYVGNIGTVTTTSGSIAQDDVSYTVTWEGSATTVQIQNTGSRQIRCTSIDIYYE